MRIMLQLCKDALAFSIVVQNGAQKDRGGLVISGQVFEKDLAALGSSEVISRAEAELVLTYLDRTTPYGRFDGAKSLARVAFAGLLALVVEMAGGFGPCQVVDGAKVVSPPQCSGMGECGDEVYKTCETCWPVFSRA